MPKINKIVLVLSTMDFDKATDKITNETKKPEIIIAYDIIEKDINNMDRMTEKY